MNIRVNDKVVETFNFSGGECHVRISPANISDKTDIFANLNSSNDLICLLLTIDAVRRVNPESQIYLTIPYFPYARQDRVCNEGEALSVKVISDMINNLQCASVTIYDPHSDVTPALINNCKIITLAQIISESILANEICNRNITLLSPDAGAEKKVLATAKKISANNKPIDVIYASKTRDTFTGNITSTQIHGEVRNKDLIILDDICDGGRTFIELARELKAHDARDVYLYVTHGIFSKGLAVLKEYIKHIYCLHTMLKPEQVDPTYLTIIGIK